MKSLIISCILLLFLSSAIFAQPVPEYFPDNKTLQAEYDVPFGYKKRIYTNMTVANGHFDFLMHIQSHSENWYLRRIQIPAQPESSMLLSTKFVPSISLLTVPINIRPAINGLRHLATADIKNVGLLGEIQKL